MPTLFSHIVTDYITIRRRGVFPRITMVEFSKPSASSNSDFFILEKFTIDRYSDVAMYLASRAVSTQQVLYYINKNVFMSSNIYMGGIDLGVPPQNIDISGFVDRGAPTMIDDETDVSLYTYIYRIFYRNIDQTGTSQYIMCSSIGTLLEEYLLQNAKDNVYGSLYRYREDGIIIAKGMPMVHVTERFRGPIEKAKEEARRTAVLNSIEFIETKLDEVDDLTDIVYDKIDLFEHQLIGSVMNNIPLATITE